MRDIKFRGKRVDNGEWVYGMLLTKKDEAFIVCEEEASYGLDDGKELFAVEWSIAEVIPETVGQFTGLKDASGKDVYEGDWLRDTKTGAIRQMLHNAPSFALVDDNRFYYWHYHIDEYEVIGNIHDKEVTT